MGYLKKNKTLIKSDLYLNALGEWQNTKAYGSSICNFESYGRYFRPVDNSMPLQMRTLNWIQADGHTWTESVTILAAIQYWENSVSKWDFITLNIDVNSIGQAEIKSNKNQIKWDIKDIDFFIKLY
jgi:hypothetical protein